MIAHPLAYPLAEFAPLLLLLLPLGTIGLAIYASVLEGKQEKRIREEHADDFPPLLVERVARAMCLAEGRNPDGYGGRRRATDGNASKQAWKLYIDQARKFLAAHAALASFHANEPTCGTPDDKL